MKKLLTSRELAKELQIHPITVHKWLRVGLPRMRATPYSHLRFDLDEVLAWMKRDQSNHTSDQAETNGEK